MEQNQLKQVCQKIKTNILTIIFFKTNLPWLCWYKDNSQRVRKNKPSFYITVYQQIPNPFVMS